MIYFDENKEAFGFEIPNFIATIDEKTWEKFANTDEWDIIGGVFTDISDTPEYQAKKEQEEYERIQRLTLTQSQLRRYLRNKWGIESKDIEPYLDADGLDEWEYASIFVRANPLFDFVAGKIGKTPADVDKMFMEASKIYG